MALMNVKVPEHITGFIKRENEVGEKTAVVAGGGKIDESETGVVNLIKRWL